MRHTDVNGSSQHSTGETYFLQFSLPVPFPCSPVCPISITQPCHLFAFYIASLAAHLSPSSLFFFLFPFFSPTKYFSSTLKVFHLWVPLFPCTRTTSATHPQHLLTKHPPGQGAPDPFFLVGLSWSSPHRGHTAQDTHCKAFLTLSPPNLQPYALLAPAYSGGTQLTFG